MAKTRTVIYIAFETDDFEYNNEKMLDLRSDFNDNKIKGGHSGADGRPGYPEAWRTFSGKQEKTNQKIIRIAKKHGAIIERSGGEEEPKARRVIQRRTPGIRRRRRNPGEYDMQGQHFAMKKKFRTFIQYMYEKLQEGQGFLEDGDLDYEWFEEILEEIGSASDALE